MNISTKPKKFCFVLMPFDQCFNDIYHLGIKQGCLDAGAYCERVDEQIFNESIIERVYNQISKADIVIADMTNRNPNVFYEVGYAHALGKTTILLTSNVSDIPFDLKQYPHIIYNNSIVSLKEDLTARVKWIIENDVSVDDANVDIDIFLKDKSLSKGGVVTQISNGNRPVFTLTLQNNSFKTYGPGEYRVSIITDANYRGFSNVGGGKSIILPNGNWMHMYPVIQEILYPSSYVSLEVRLSAFSIGNSVYSEDQVITIRLFTPTGFRDFSLGLEYK